MKDKNITLVNAKNLLDTKEIDLLCSFEIDDNKYIIYSKNEHDYDGNIIVYSGKIEIKNNMQYIRNIDDKEYLKVKDIIKKMINYSGEEYDV